jgi:hypothetical protein
MKKVLIGTILTVLVFSVQAQQRPNEKPDKAHCRNSDKEQVVSIIKDNTGAYKIKHKKRFKHCLVNNSGRDGTIIWKFKKEIPECQNNPNSCTVTFNNYDQGANPVSCYFDNNSNYNCKSDLNNLKRHCDKEDDEGVATGMCVIDYTITIDGKTIDPTLLIKPRPTN